MWQCIQNMSMEVHASSVMHLWLRCFLTFLICPLMCCLRFCKQYILIITIAILHVYTSDGINHINMSLHMQKLTYRLIIKLKRSRIFNLQPGGSHPSLPPPPPHQLPLFTLHNCISVTDKVKIYEQIVTGPLYVMRVI